MFSSQTTQKVHKYPKRRTPVSSEVIKKSPWRMEKSSTLSSHIQEQTFQVPRIPFFHSSTSECSQVGFPFSTVSSNFQQTSPNRTSSKKNRRWKHEKLRELPRLTVFRSFIPTVKLFLVWFAPRHATVRGTDGLHHSSPAGRFSSILLMNFMRISVTLSPLRVSWANLTSTAIWTWITHTNSSNGHFVLSAVVSPRLQTGPHHLQGPSEDSTQKVGVDERAVVVWQLHKVHQRVVLQDERELVSGGAPVGHAGGDSQIHLKRNLKTATTWCRRNKNLDFLKE